MTWRPARLAVDQALCRPPPPPLLPLLLLLLLLQSDGWRSGVRVCFGGAGVSERINGSHYMVLTVWPGRGVMDVLWQVMVLCSLRLSERR